MFLCVSIVPSGAAAQDIPGAPSGAPLRSVDDLPRASLAVAPEAKASVTVRVLGPDAQPLKQQAFVRLYRTGSGAALGGGVTNAQGSLSFSDLPGTGRYEVEVSAAGYHTRQKKFEVGHASAMTEVDVALRPASPTTADVPAPPIPDEARKHINKGLAAFRAGRLKKAQQELKDAYDAAPQSVATNYLLGTLYLRMNDLPQSERYFASAVAIYPSDVPALVGLGHVRYQQGDLKGSAEALHRAAALDATNWQAFWLLAQIDLRRHNFPSALSEAQEAVQSAHGKAAGAEFIEGEAQAELGRTAEAVRSLQAFLKDAPSDPNAPLARQLVGKLELFPAAQQTPGTFVMNLGPTKQVRLDAVAKASDATPVLAVSAPALPLPNWEPPSANQEKPPVAEGVVCPAGEVIRKAGERVSELVNDINRIDATEEVTQEELSVLGRPIATEKRTFDYQISITDSSSGLLNVSENRRSAGGSTFLDHVSMFGLADLPLVFHSSLRRDFTLTCEGLGQWKGRATWLVYFRQRADRPAQIRSYQFLDGSSYDAALDGRAWIAADTYQIVRIQADLMKAIPQIGIGSEEDVIEYGPVPFHSMNGVLWLPKSADIYYFYKHRPYHRHHAFRDYRVFSVSTSEKIAPPDVTRTEEKNDRRR